MDEYINTGSRKLEPVEALWKLISKAHFQKPDVLQIMECMGVTVEQSERIYELLEEKGLVDKEGNGKKL